MRGGLLGWAVLIGVALAGSAGAQDEERRREVNVFLKGGVGTFTGDLDDYVQAGPAWGLTVNVQPLNVLGVEVGYEGSRNGLSDPRLPESVATRHGASALVKLAPPFIERVKPFVGAGLGASYVRIAGGGGGIYRNDLMEEIPLTAGIELNGRSVTAGIRATYRALVDEGFVPATNEGAGLLDASITLGGRF